MCRCRPDGQPAEDENDTDLQHGLDGQGRSFILGKDRGANHSDDAEQDQRYRTYDRKEELYLGIHGSLLCFHSRALKVIRIARPPRLDSLANSVARKSRRKFQIRSILGAHHKPPRW